MHPEPRTSHIKALCSPGDYISRGAACHTCVMGCLQQFFWVEVLLWAAAKAVSLLGAEDVEGEGVCRGEGGGRLVGQLQRTLHRCTVQGVRIPCNKHKRVLASLTWLCVDGHCRHAQLLTCTLCTAGNLATVCHQNLIYYKYHGLT